MAAADGPKLDMKMLVLPAMLFLSKKIDLTVPENIKMAQIGFVVVAVVMLLVHGFVYLRINAMDKKESEKKIWVPPKPKPTLPFGLGPPPEPVKAEEYEATTYHDHEIKLLKESAQSIVMSGAISLGMSFKFNVHVSLLIQAVMMPLNATDSVVLKKYLLGIKKDRLYNEELVQPTEESLKRAATAAAVAAAAAAGATGSALLGNQTHNDDDEPRVVELPSKEEEEAAEEKKKKNQQQQTKEGDVEPKKDK